MHHDVRCFATGKELARAGAELVAASAAEAVRERGLFTLVIPGGRSPRQLFELIAGNRGAGLPWDRTHVFWGDERCVPPDHPYSNVRQGRELLTSPAAVPEVNIHPPQFSEPPRKMAGDYREHIDDFFRRHRLPPAFDLVILGMGADGHVASIFPDETGVAEKETVFATAGAKASPPVPRISLGFPALLSARRIILIAAGKEKAACIAKNDRSLPAARIAAAPQTVVLASREP